MKTFSSWNVARSKVTITIETYEIVGIVRKFLYRVEEEKFDLLIWIRFELSLDQVWIGIETCQIHTVAENC